MRHSAKPLSRRTVLSILTASVFSLPSFKVAANESAGAEAASIRGDMTQAETNLPAVVTIATTPLEGIEVPVSQIPANVQVLKAKNIREQGVTNVADLLNNHLGSVSVTNGPGNPYQNDVSYRGFQATSLLGAPVGLSVYFDGVRMNEPFGSTINWDLIPANAISSMSVLPGSNPIFGLNTLGGALVVNTKTGAGFAGTSVTATGGSFGRKALRFESGWQDKERNTDTFIAANLDRQDGYRQHSNSDIRQAYGKIRWHGRETDLGLSFALADNSLSGTQSLPLSMLGDPRAAYTWPDSTLNKMAMLNLKATQQLSDTRQLTGNLFYRKADSKSLTSNANYDDGCAGVNGINECATAFISGTGTVRSSVATNAYGFSRFSADVNSQVVQSNTRQDTVGANLQWNSLDRLAGMDNNLIIGAAANYSRVRFGQDTWLAQMVDYQTVINHTNPRYYFGNIAANAGGFNGSGLIRDVSLNASATNVSLFVTDTLEMTKKLNVTASVSYNVSSIDQEGANNQHLNDDGGSTWTSSSGTRYYNPAYVGAHQYSAAAPGYTILTTPAGRAAGPETASLYGRHRYSRLNPSLGFTFKPSPEKELNFFGGYSESMRAPTPIELSCADPARPCALPTGFNGDPELHAVVAKTFEFGARGRWGASTFWNAAVYAARTSNDIQFIFSNATSLGYFSNVGTTERKGFELGISGRYERLFLAANYGYVSATYQTPFQTVAGVNVVAGNKMPGMADQTLKLRGTFEVSPRVIVGANVLAVGGQYAFGDEGNSDENGKVPGYTSVNIELHYKMNSNLTLVGHLNNLFDRRHYTHGVLGTNIYTGVDEQFRTPAPQRAVWLGLIYNFGD